MKMRACERERKRARVYGINLKLISVHYCNIGIISSFRTVPVHTHTHTHTRARARARATRTDAHILMPSSEDREPNMHVSMRING